MTILVRSAIFDFLLESLIFAWMGSVVPVSLGADVMFDEIINGDDASTGNLLHREELSSYLANLNIHYVGIKLIVRISSSLQRH